ncbi:MAG: hypothetical protein JW951_09815 [Lentisphaerae bacterium]|nr:hypothetical protein [Lentisphaerota bacterium]
MPDEEDIYRIFPRQRTVSLACAVSGVLLIAGSAWAYVLDTALYWLPFLLCLAGSVLVGVAVLINRLERLSHTRPTNEARRFEDET